MDNNEQIRQIVREELGFILGSAQYNFNKHLKINDAKNIMLGYLHGTKIGTDTTQKLGFYGKTPISQHAAPATLGDVIQLLKDYGLSA